jgi:hypothetical protein
MRTRMQGGISEICDQEKSQNSGSLALASEISADVTRRAELLDPTAQMLIHLLLSEQFLYLPAHRGERYRFGA